MEILSDLYISTRDPNYLFNQGRCFQQNWRLEEALGRFEEYLHVIATSPGPASEAGKAEAEKHVARCKELLAERNGAKPSAATLEPTPPAAIAPEPAPPGVAPQNPEPAATAAQSGAQASTPPASPGAGLRTAGLVLGIAGGVAGVAGVLLNLKANAVTSDIEAKSGGYNPSALSERDNYRTLAWIGYGGGATLLVAGTVLYLIGAHPNDSDVAGVALTPLAGAGSTGIALTGAF